MIYIESSKMLYNLFFAYIKMISFQLKRNRLLREEKDKYHNNSSKKRLLNIKKIIKRLQKTRRKSR